MFHISYKIKSFTLFVILFIILLMSVEPSINNAENNTIDSNSKSTQILPIDKSDGNLTLDSTLEVLQKISVNKLVISNQTYPGPAEFKDHIMLNIQNSKITILIFEMLILIIFFIILIYNQINKGNILSNFQRRLIYELIKEKPGIHLRKIMKILSLKPGSLSYHLNLLEKEGFIKSIQKGEYRCFYLEGLKSGFKIILTKLQQKILFIINENPGISLTELSNAIEKNKMVSHYNTHVLEDVGVIKKEKEGRIATYYVTSEAANYLE